MIPFRALDPVRLVRRTLSSSPDKIFDDRGVPNLFERRACRRAMAKPPVHGGVVNAEAMLEGER